MSPVRSYTNYLALPVLVRHMERMTAYMKKVNAMVEKKKQDKK